MKYLFLSLANRVRVLLKISLIGVLVKTGLTFLFSCSDLNTDMFVFWSYRPAGMVGLA